MKGNLFSGKASISPSKFSDFKRGKEQLLSARQLGMILPYMNIDTVWQSFCDTYNGILTLLESFDAWYLQTQQVSSQMADEWPKFIRKELDSVVSRAREDLKMMSVKREFAVSFYALAWSTVMSVTSSGEIQKVKLARTDKCRNLPATTIGRFRG